jgi:hypothetical protein
MTCRFAQQAMNARVLCGGRDATIAEVAGSGLRDAGRKPDTMPPAGDLASLQARRR